MIAGGPGGAGARLYVLESDAWSDVEVDFFTGSRAGTSVAISADGTVGAVGSIYYRSAAGGSAAGSVHVYELP